MPTHLGALSATQWQPIGPAPISSPGVAQGFTDGRIEVAAPDPADPDVMYVGGSNGGVWKTATWGFSSSQGGPIWLPLTDDQPSLDFSGYHPLIVLPIEDTRRLILGVVSGTGAGVLKSTNGGLGWQLLGNNVFEGGSLGSIDVDPDNTKTMYVAVRKGGLFGGGVYKSTDGGVNWQNTTAFHAGGASDLVMDPCNAQTLYTGLVSVGNNGVVTAGVYKTINGGMNWSVQTDLSSTFFLGRTVRLEVAPSAPGTVYATVFDVDINTGDDVPNHYKTANGGQTWSQLATPGGDPETRAWHVVLAVDPQNADHVFVNSAYALWESVAGGQSWTHFESIGDDWVNMTFDANNLPVATADRDLYAFDTATDQLDSREGNLQVTQFYTITLDLQDAERVYGVAQDHFDPMGFNGSILWNYLPGGGGEAGKVLVDPTDSQLLYASDPLLPEKLVRRSSDGGQNWTVILTNTDFEKEDYSFAYSAQKSFAMDLGNPSHLLIGTIKVYETTDAKAASPTWTDISGVLSPSAKVSDQYITALAISANGQVIYAATADGHVWVKEPNHFWEQRDKGLFGMGAGKVVDLRIDPFDPKRAFAVTNGPGGKNVWYLKHTEKLNEWTNVSGDLPTNLAAVSIFVDWQYSIPALYVGTSRNVYHSVNLGAHWEKFGQFLPNTTVSDLQYFPFLSILAAGTTGRGAWEILIPSAQVSGQVFWDHNGNSVQNVGDDGLPGVIVFLDADGNGALDANEYSAFTNAQGNYVFANVPPATYDLRQILPAGYVPTTPPHTNLVVAGVDLTHKDFGDKVPVSFRIDFKIAAHLIEAFNARFMRQLDRLEARFVPGEGGRFYSPFSFAPGESRVPRRTVRTKPTRSDTPMYLVISDLDDLPGRLPGEPVGAKREFDDRRGSEEPR